MSESLQHLDADTLLRFWGNVDRNEGGCWNWTGYGSRGYGQISINGKVVTAHRVSYHLAHPGFPIPYSRDAQLDHLCRNRGCVNPEHLEVVDTRENTLRGRTSALNPSQYSKHPGVTWSKADRKWQASIRQHGRRVHLGYFTSEIAAAGAYQAARERIDNGRDPR